MQINLKISRFVADPTLINRVVISGIVLNEASLNMIYYCDHLPRLQELVLTDRALHYLIYKRTFSGRKYCKVSPGTSELVRSYYGSYPLFYYDYRPISGIRGCGIKLLLSSNITSRVWKQRVQGNLFAGFIRTKVEGTQNTKHLNKWGKIYSPYLNIIFTATLAELPLSCSNPHPHLHVRYGGNAYERRVDKLAEISTMLAGRVAQLWVSLGSFNHIWIELKEIQ